MGSRKPTVFWAGNVPGSGVPRVAKARDAEQSVVTVGDDCSPLSDLFAIKYPEEQSQVHRKLQLSQVSLTGCSVGPRREGTWKKARRMW